MEVTFTFPFTSKRHQIRSDAALVPCNLFYHLKLIKFLDFEIYILKKSGLVFEKFQ